MFVLQKINIIFYKYFIKYEQDYYKDLEKCIRNLIQMPNEVPITIKKIIDNDNKENK